MVIIHDAAQCLTVIQTIMQTKVKFPLLKRYHNDSDSVYAFIFCLVPMELPHLVLMEFREFLILEMGHPRLPLMRRDSKDLKWDIHVSH
jgi:hypothetical protein